MLTIISVYAHSEITTGTHKRHLGLLNELSERGHNIQLFSPTNILEKDGSNISIKEPEKGGLFPQSIQTFFAVKKQFKDAKKQLAGGNIILVFGFGHIVASLYLKQKLGIPVVFAVRSDMYAYRKIRLSKNKEDGSKILTKLKMTGHLSVFSIVERYVYRKSNLIIVQNTEEYEQLAQRYSIDKSKIKVIGNNVNFRKMETPPFENSSSYLRSIIFVGSLISRKGIMLLLQAMRSLLEEGISLQLDILGKGRLQNEIEAFIKSYQMEETVTVHGFVPDPLKYIADADLLVMPSLSDSFPNTVLEALSIGTPVIGSDGGGIREILKYDTLLFDADSIYSIADKIKSLLNTDTYKKCRQQCEERRKAFIFDWTGKFEKVLKEIA